MDGFLSDSEVRLRELTGSLGYLFARPEPRELFHTLVEGMLSNLERKNGWTLAQRAGHTHPGRVQTFLCRSAWSAQALEAEVRRYVVECNLLAEQVINVHHDRKHSLRWFAWRLRHRTRAKISHYTRRGDPLPASLQRWRRPTPPDTPP